MEPEYWGAIYLIAFVTAISAISGQPYVQAVLGFLRDHSRIIAIVVMFLAFLAFLSGQN